MMPAWRSHICAAAAAHHAATAELRLGMLELVTRYATDPRLAAQVCIGILVVCAQRLVPTVDLLDDVVRISRPDERLGVGVGLGKKAVDRGLQLDQGAEYA